TARRRRQRHRTSQANARINTNNPLLNRAVQERAKSREEGWDSTRDNTRIKEYNALFDPNMRHFFETPSVQAHLLRTGQIDRNGRVIDFQKQKGKLHIIEQEFKQAERIEYWRQKE
ncbi:unnamed protein product, partial [Ectocarpus sp. 8 AP-2014]